MGKKVPKGITKDNVDRIVLALMTILDPDCKFGFKVTAPEHVIEALKQSDSPFAGFVISALIEDDKASEEHYEDWVRRTLDRTVKE